MKKWFEFASQTRVLAATFVLTLVFLFVVFPALPVNGELLDYKSSYTHDEAMAAMEEYGPEGRRVYAWASPTLDTLFPIVYVSFFAGLIYRCRPTERLWWLAFIPVAAGIVDLGENNPDHRNADPVPGRVPGPGRRRFPVHPDQGLQRADLPDPGPPAACSRGSPPAPGQTVGPDGLRPLARALRPRRFTTPRPMAAGSPANRRAPTNCSSVGSGASLGSRP